MFKGKTKFFWVSAALVIALSGSLLLQPGRAQQLAQIQTTPDSTLRSVTVIGTGQAFGTPDQAVINLGVQTDADTAAAALDQNNQQMQSLINALTQAGVARQDIQTQTLQVSPRYQDPQPPQTGTPELAGYSVVNIVLVRVRNLDNLGELLDTAVQAGANVVHGIQMEVSDQAEQLDQARQGAMADARQKAEQLAALANADLGEVITISETGLTPIPFDGRGGAAPLEAAVPIEPGAQLIQVNVQVTWRLVGGTGLPSTGQQTPSPTPTLLRTPTRTPTTQVTPATPQATPATPQVTPATVTPGTTPVTPQATPDETPFTPQVTPDTTAQVTPGETPVTPAATP